MGYDTDVLRIISMNASGRKGRMYNDFRRDNLRNLVENERPDIMFLPGDNPSPNTFTQTSYQQLLDPTNNETVLLYDSTRLKIHQQPTDSQFKIPNCDLDKVLSPMVDICSPAPASQIVKKFVCVSWHWELTTIDRGSQVIYENGKQFMMFAQFLAWFTGTEVLIGGDFNLEKDEIKTLINEHNRIIQDGIDSVKPDFEKFGYMECMTENIHRPERRLRQLKLHTCNNQEKNTDISFFVASKEMQLMETRHTKLESLAYRSAGLQLNTSTRVPTYCPEPTYTKTQMYIPPRPPKNHGEYESLHLDDNIAVIGCGKEVKFLHYFSNNYSSIKKCLGNFTHLKGLLGELAVATRGGRMIGWTDARQYARLSLYFNQVCEILNEREVYRDEVDFAEHNYKERYSDMPCVGTRVRRGCHWNYENQDNLGVGTVIGHSERIGWLHVEWDNGSRILHQFGHDGIKEKYDIRVCDEPRHIPENQQIANGCLVRKEYESLHLDDNIAVIGCGKECLLGELALAAKGGRLIGWKDARQYARLSLYFKVAGKLLRMFPSEKITEAIVRRECSSYGGGGEDINQIRKIFNEEEVYGDIDDIFFDSFEERYLDMPCAGTRVRRGRHWNYENQDGYGVGTVIGHCKRVGWLFVEWDNGRQFSYQFGYDGDLEEYDIKVCNEPRNIPENQEIAIGCLVRKGPHWQWGNQNGSEDSIGTVYRIKPRGEVYILRIILGKHIYRDSVYCVPEERLFEVKLE
uniref:Putative E3 ubiquitin-protein ligase HERC2 n=1 Tax=Magallana gigas TaxID=29159 RepID=K1PIC0_MAGGI